MTTLRTECQIANDRSNKSSANSNELEAREADDFHNLISSFLSMDIRKQFYQRRLKGWLFECIDVKKNFFTFFIVVTFFTFLTCFLFSRFFIN